MTGHIIILKLGVSLFIQRKFTFYQKYIGSGTASVNLCEGWPWIVPRTSPSIVMQSSNQMLPYPSVHLEKDKLYKRMLQRA